MNKLENENRVLKNELEMLTEVVTKNVTTLNEYLKALDESSIVTKLDKNLTYLHINELFCKVSGFERKKILGERLGKIFHPNMDKESIRSMMDTIKEGKVYRGVVQNKTKKGGRIFLDTVIVPIFDADGETTEYVEISRDITDMIEKERELERLRAKEMSKNIKKAKEIGYEELLEAIPAPAAICKSDGEIVWANSELLIILQHNNKKSSKKENLGSYFVKKEPFFYATNSKWVEQCALFGEDEEYVVMLSCGEELTFRLKAKSQRGDSGLFVLVMVECNL